MTEETKALMTRQEVEQALFAVGDGIAMPLDTKIVDWHEIRDAIAPEGELIPAAALIGQTFALYRAKPFPSRYEGGPDEIYWVVVRTEDGQLYNTVLGGTVIVPVLDKFYKLNQFLAKAKEENNEELIDQLVGVGAGCAWRFTLETKANPDGQDYYYFA